MKSRTNKEYNKKYYQENKPKFYNYSLNRMRDLIKDRDCVLKARYGISIIEYDAIFAKQGNRCAICLRTNNNSIALRNFPVDHNHITKEVRGILCNSCNINISFVEYDLEKLDRLVKYLKGDKP